MRKKRQPIIRDKDGFIENICVECGKIRYSRQKRLKPLCKSCGIKKSFQSRPAVGLKTIDNIEQIISEYKSGIGLKSLEEKYGISAMTVRSKIIAFGETTRNCADANRITHNKHNTVATAREKIKQLCKTGEFQKSISARLQGIPVEEWKGFITPENQRLVASPEYKQWQKSVFKRDNETCQLCGKTKCPIAAHHIYMKAKYPDKVLDVNNGITLCDKCHHKTIGCEDRYIDYFVNLLLGDLCGKKQ